MKKIFTTVVICSVFYTCIAQTITYPVAEKKPVTEEFYKKYTVTDDYRWMENSDDPQLKKWVADENSISGKFVLKASNKNDARIRIDELSNVTYNNPVKKGKYYFYYSYYDNTGVPALYVGDDLTGGNFRVIVDPNFISGKDKISIKDYEVSQNSKYLAYEFSRSGSDWAEIEVTKMDGQQLKDHLTNVKFSNIAWQGDGFFYSSYPQVNGMGVTQGQTVLYHKLGTEQTQDSVIFKRNDPTIRFNFLMTKDGQYFILSEYNSKVRLNNYFYIDYHEQEPSLKPLITNLKYSIDIIDSHDGKIIAQDSHTNGNGSIIEIDPQNPMNWKEIAPAYSESLLMNVVPLKDKIFTVYQSKLRPSIIAMDYSGNILQTITYPLGTSIGGLAGAPDDKELLYSYESYTTPPIVYTMNTQSYTRKLNGTSSVSYDYDKIEYKELEYLTKDSVKIPIMLIYRKGTKLDGNNPTLLETYGGFGVVTTPRFDAGLIYFLNKGGVYAYAYVRGGGDFGTKWARAGEGKYKQNSITDFIAGAEYLIKEGYTNPSKLAISGASNGGLVVAAAAIQRPDLFKAVVPIVAPLDMIRFENFTIGAMDVGEYGTVKDSTSFTLLYNYSPYNNIKDNVNYPAMLIITSDHDDRVPPLHSYKFAAKLQSRPVQTNPVLLMERQQAGHNGSSSNGFITKLTEKANLYGFVVEMLK
jgi:prolyl oligopeptidase